MAELERNFRPSLHSLSLRSLFTVAPSKLDYYSTRLPPATTCLKSIEVQIRYLHLVKDFVKVSIINA